MSRSNEEEDYFPRFKRSIYVKNDKLSEKDIGDLSLQLMKTSLDHSKDDLYLSCIVDLNNTKTELLKVKNELKKLKPRDIKKYDNESPIGLLQSISNKLYYNEILTCVWRYSPLENLNKLKNDTSGKAGELFVEILCKKSNIPYVYNQDINSKDGTYDIIIEDRRVEIKTAKLGKNKGFQHESIRENGYDYLLFIDVLPSYFYMTIIPRFDLSQKNNFLKRKAHLRKGSSNIFKLDLTENILKNLVKEGHSITISEETTLQEVRNFIINNII